APRGCSMLPRGADVARGAFCGARRGPGGVEAPRGGPLVSRGSLPAAARGPPPADLDMGPAGETPSVTGMCAEFGNACVLTAEKQGFYNEPTVFFVAPTCDALPNNTAKPFRGGTSKVKLRVTAGKRGGGRSRVGIGWGRNGAVTLYALDVQGKFDDGIGKQSGVNVSAATIEAARITQPPDPAPPEGVRTFFFDGEGSVQSPEATSC